MPLGQKWKVMADFADENSKCYIWSAADLYSEPKRFKKTYQYINVEGYDWVCDRMCPFYDITSGKTILYADRECQQRAGLSASTRMEVMKRLPDNNYAKKVDGLVVKAVRPKTFKNIFDGENEDWKYGFNTDGMNLISLNRAKYYHNVKWPFEKTDLDLRDYIPKNVIDKLFKL